MVNNKKKINSEIAPSGWSTRTIGEIALEIGDGNYSTKYPKSDEFVKNGIPFIRSVNIQSGKIILNDVRYITKEKHSTLIKGQLQPGDVLITNRGELGKCAIVDEDIGEANLNAQVVRIKVNSNIISNKFLYYLISSNAFKNNVLNNTSGSALKQLPLKILSDISLSYPPLPEQQKIASILTSVDDAIEKTEAIIEQTEKVKKGLMQQLLTKGIGHTKFKKTEIGEIPEEWEVKPLSLLIISLEAGVSVNSENRLKKSNEKGILKTSAVTRRIFNPQEHKTILSSEITRASIQPKKGHIIISRMNTPLLVGASAFLGKDYDDLYLPDRLWLASINNSVANTVWLSYILTWSKMRARISEIATGTSGSMKNISKKAFMTLRVVVPPIHEQLKIANILNSFDEKTLNEQKKLEKLQTIKKGLMQVLLTGKVRVKVDENEVNAT